ncbi:dihydrodipicolinate synthase family protein [Roseibium sp. MMSF_3412]|uniref:dihydrodipicolinate synthase family protein n=1 Tax=Roseibium sp. MMSF_3412 TaxID=3046712 RepID=UPI00273DF699|nr:dihydrodipicolinate synthase family protein [Roseibium sp. MMSF_3412]
MAHFGILTALLTPFAADGSIDGARLAGHAAQIVNRGVAGVTLFGTTGEGASISAGERSAGISALLDAGLSGNCIVLGVYGSATTDVAAQIDEGLRAGISRFLVPPPFYFSDAGEDGVFQWFSELLASTGSQAGFILYNIPQVTGVGISPALTRRLKEGFPERIIAIKDSSGDWANAVQLMEGKALPVLIGDERLLHKSVPMGCAGSITGVANLYPERLCSIMATSTEDTMLTRTVDRIVALPVIPTLKVLLADALGDPVWENLRAPLTRLTAQQKSDILALEGRGMAA